MTSSSLMKALDNHDLQETARILSTMPSEVSIRDPEDRVALHYAAEAMDLDTFRAIYEQDTALVDSQDKNGHTPLMMAVMGGRTELVDFLISKGANLNHVDKEGRGPVHWAVVCGQLETLNFILEKGAEAAVPDLAKAHPLHYATTWDEISHDTAISIIHTLLRRGAHVNCLDIDERTPILWAASNGNVEALMSLKQAGGDIQHRDRDRLGVFHCAASHGYHEVIEVILSCVPRSLVDSKDRTGITPLFYAVSHGHFEAARMLLAADANPNHQDNRLRTASHCAAAKGQLRMLKLLKQFGASFEIQNYRGDLPIHEAVQAGSKEVVEWLLALHPSTMDSCSHEGRTGLHLAAASGNIEIVVFLCSSKCDVNPLMLFKDDLYTPLDLAERQQHQALHASEIPKEQRDNYKEYYVEQMTNAKLNRGKLLRQSSDGDTPKKLRRRRTSTEIEIKGTQTTPHNEGANGVGKQSRATSAQIKEPRIPKATSTTDLSEQKKDKYDDRIERILQEEIRKAMEDKHKDEDDDDVTTRNPTAKARPKSSKKRPEPEVSSEEDSGEDSDEVIMKKNLKMNASHSEGDKSEDEIDESLLGRSISDSSEEEESELESEDTKDSKENRGPSGSRPKSAKKRETNQSNTPTKPVTPIHSSLKKTGSAGKTKVVRLNTNDKNEANDEENVTEIQASSSGKGGKAPKVIMRVPKSTPQSQILIRNSRIPQVSEDGRVFLCRCLHKQFTQSIQRNIKLQAKFRKRVKREPEIGDDGGEYDIYEDEWEELEQTERVTGKDARRKYVHEKAIFQELTHLKRMQIQYGKVQEKVLVRSLVANFCKMHGLNPADFKFYTFYAWEKFLYDQLKMIYMEERERLLTAGSSAANAKANTVSRMNRFETRLRQARAVPLNDKIKELSRIYGSSNMTAGKSPYSRKDDESLSTSTVNTGKRCDCLGRHMLIKQKN